MNDMNNPSDEGQLHDYLTSRADSLALHLARLRHRGGLFVAGEISLFVAAVAAVSAYIVCGLVMVWLVLAAVCLATYMAVRVCDTRNSAAIDKAEALRQVYVNELKALGGDYTCLGDGVAYIDSAHPYALDLDIFGRGSLFNRMCRTVTTGGDDQLADWLGSDFGADAQSTRTRLGIRARTIDALAVLREWRACYISLGVRHKTDTSTVARTMLRASRYAMPAAYGRRLTVVAVVCVLVVFYALVSLAFASVVPESVPTMYGVTMLFVTYLVVRKPMSRLSSDVSGMLEALGGLVEVLCHVRTMPVSGSADGTYMPEIKARAVEAMATVESLKGIADAVDRRGNQFWMMLADLLFVNDFFIIRRFLRWQSDSLDSLMTLTDTLGRLDALVSMATFQANSYGTVRAEVTDCGGVVLDARGMRHPFIGRKAVGNDFSIADGNYYIITGANMAGKSTFLRTLGINYVLAMNGMRVFADSMRVSVFSLYTSMRTTDDLNHGISYFNAELLRLQQLLAFCKAHTSTLIILDEILKGTNSADKLNGSRMFLEYISQRDVTGVIATHDLELSRMEHDCPSRFRNFCFEIGLGDSVTYSYKITPGVARNQNATYLLGKMLHS